MGQPTVDPADSQNESQNGIHTGTQHGTQKGPDHRLEPSGSLFEVPVGLSFWFPFWDPLGCHFGVIFAPCLVSDRSWTLIFIKNVDFHENV